MADRDPAAVRAIAARCGCAIVAEQRTLFGGVALRLECPTQQDKIDLLLELGIYDGTRFPDCTQLARAIISRVDADTAARLDAIMRWVQLHIGSVDEAQETFPSALQVLLDGLGDCDDHTLLVIALCTAVGLEVTCEAFGAETPAHVAALGRLDDGSWAWMETTIAGARLGEHPIDVCRRLGIAMRKDITG